MYTLFTNISMKHLIIPFPFSVHTKAESEISSYFQPSDPIDEDKLVS
jgi:hypothetical protein